MNKDPKKEYKSVIKRKKKEHDKIKNERSVGNSKRSRGMGILN